MTFSDFARELKKRGATTADIYRLDHEGRKNADSAFRAEIGTEYLPGITTENDFRSFCAAVGREFVLDNLADGDNEGLFRIY